MTCRKHLIWMVASFGIVGISLLSGSCTDSDLYQWKTTPYQANKLTVSGNVCTDDLQQADFPKKILFMIDMSQSLRGGNNDPNGMRGKAVEDVINLWGKNPSYHFGVTIFGAKGKNLLSDEEGKPIGFTRDMSKLLAAAKQVKTGGGFTEVSTCRSGRCRDLRSAVSLANSIVTGDILASDPGEVARTTYILVMFAGGPPVPALGRCPCRDKDNEKVDNTTCTEDADCKSNKCHQGKCMNLWEKCPWDECENCKVTCDTSISKCAGDVCVPVCNPGCDNDEYCNDQFMCIQGTPVAPPTVPPLSTLPPITPDTFTYRVLPPTSPGNCPKTSDLTCVFAAGGHPDSCEEKVLILDVRELKEFAIQNGAGAFQLHALYLPDNDPRQPTDPFYPPPLGNTANPTPLPGCSGNVDADKARAVRILSQMAYAANGGFQEFAQAAQIPNGFIQVGQDIFAGQDSLVFKELVVTNINVLADANGIHADTDADGLSDETEKELKTCPSDEDSDGDGLGDAIEVKLASDPTKADKPVECIDLKTAQETDEDPCKEGTDKTWIHYTIDQDRDGLNECEERLLGTDDSLYDTDADGIPDKVEFIAGTNYLANDPLQDSDMDGVVNREEVRGHTDPRSNDAQSQLDLAYRYEEVDEGLKDVHSFSQPTNITGVQIKNVSSETAPGVGWLKFDPGPPATLAWRDYGDMDVGGNYGAAVEIDQPSKEGYVLTSCRLKSGGGCTKDSEKKFITVMVEGKGSYPAASMVEKIHISSAKRNCLRFTVRNITLLETGKDRYKKTTGNNTIVIYFAEAPSKAKDGYGIFRIADQPFNYHKGPPEYRTPKAPEIFFADDEFTLDIKKQ